MNCLMRNLGLSRFNFEKVMQSASSILCFRMCVSFGNFTFACTFAKNSIICSTDRCAFSDEAISILSIVRPRTTISVWLISSWPR